MIILGVRVEYRVFFHSYGDSTAVKYIFFTKSGRFELYEQKNAYPATVNGRWFARPVVGVDDNPIITHQLPKDSRLRYTTKNDVYVGVVKVLSTDQDSNMNTFIDSTTWQRYIEHGRALPKEGLWITETDDYVPDIVVPMIFSVYDENYPTSEETIIRWRPSWMVSASMIRDIDETRIVNAIVQEVVRYGSSSAGKTLQAGTLHIILNTVDLGVFAGKILQYLETATRILQKQLNNPSPIMHHHREKRVIRIQPIATTVIPCGYPYSFQHNSIKGMRDVMYRFAIGCFWDKPEVFTRQRGNHANICWRLLGGKCQSVTSGDCITVLNASSPIRINKTQTNLSVVHGINSKRLHNDERLGNVVILQMDRFDRWNDDNCIKAIAVSCEKLGKLLLDIRTFLPVKMDRVYIPNISNVDETEPRFNVQVNVNPNYGHAPPHFGPPGPPGQPPAGPPSGLIGLHQPRRNR